MALTGRVCISYLFILLAPHKYVHCVHIHGMYRLIGTLWYVSSYNILSVFIYILHIFYECDCTQNRFQRLCINGM